MRVSYTGIFVVTASFLSLVMAAPAGGSDDGMRLDRRTLTDREIYNAGSKPDSGSGLDTHRYPIDREICQYRFKGDVTAQWCKKHGDSFIPGNKWKPSQCINITEVKDEDLQELGNGICYTIEAQSHPIKKSKCQYRNKGGVDGTWCKEHGDGYILGNKWQPIKCIDIKKVENEHLRYLDSGICYTQDPPSV
ncbi:hypothetical protein AMATHDRAFT_61142 [Amanita thiersii Skay4041]|uniref:Secreted protein n=1 Tax=Amanita thiersii Skay4041 TaxID=703135 RepID=A0A2A9NQA4_9AGAR|nr:hypothetical protein AMATHDRAFT_61142 [Amanita thiersii Skay4041]